MIRAAYELLGVNKDQTKVGHKSLLHPASPNVLTTFETGAQL